MKQVFGSPQRVCCVHLPLIHFQVSLRVRVCMSLRMCVRISPNVLVAMAVQTDRRTRALKSYVSELNCEKVMMVRMSAEQKKKKTPRFQLLLDIARTSFRFVLRFLMLVHLLRAYMTRHNCVMGRR